MTEAKRGRADFAREDVAEIVMGACIMAFPVAVTEEVWDLGSELDLPHVLFFALASICALAILIFLLQHRSVGANAKAFVQRVLSTYFLTLIVAALLLLGVDRLELFSDPLLGLKRAILVAFPASFAATAVDNLGS